MRIFPMAALLIVGCAGTQQAGTRSQTLRMIGPDCRMTCSAQLHPGEVVTDCTPPLDFDPGKRDSSMTVCFYVLAPAK